jgi:hypothetical protein
LQSATQQVKSKRTGDSFIILQWVKHFFNGEFKPKVKHGGMFTLGKGASNLQPWFGL